MNYDYIKQGDCIELMKDIPEYSVDVAFTSPPYNRKRNDKYLFYDDRITDYYGFLCKFTDELVRVTKKWVIVNVQKNYYNKEDVFKYIGRYSNQIQEIFIWEKTNPMPASGNAITNAYEYFIFIGKDAVKSNSTYTKNVIQSSVYSNMPKEHKAVMKPEICKFFIETFTQEGDIVLDPFLGIGTTALTCKRANRHYIGFEINGQYFKIAKQRLYGNRGKKDIVRECIEVLNGERV